MLINKTSGYVAFKVGKTAVSKDMDTESNRIVHSPLLDSLLISKGRYFLNIFKTPMKPIRIKPLNLIEPSDFKVFKRPHQDAYRIPHCIRSRWRLQLPSPIWFDPVQRLWGAPANHPSSDGGMIGEDGVGGSLLALEMFNLFGCLWAWSI